MVNRDMDRGRLLMMLCAGAALALATLGCTTPRRDAAATDTTRPTAAGCTPDASPLTDVVAGLRVMARGPGDRGPGPRR